jgi:oligoendopeptidase F
LLVTTTQKLPRRAELPVEYTWDLTTIYPSAAAWEADVAQMEQVLAEVVSLQGTLADGPAALLKILAACDHVSMLLGRLSIYALCLLDIDSLDTHAQALAERADTLAAEAGAAVAFVEPEILELPDATITQWLKDEPALGIYRYALEELARQRRHICDAKIEALLASAEEVARAPGSIFTVLTEADLSFGTIADEAGSPLQLSVGRFIRCMDSQDRRVRRDAYEAFYGAFAALRNTFAATLAAQVRTHIFFARARGYDSCLHAALEPHDIPISVYTNLVATVDRHLDHLHRYVRLRKHMLGFNDQRVYDLFAPLVSEISVTIAYPEATRIIQAALAPLGPEYADALQRAFADRWIDVYENAGKASGAYTIDAHAITPRILINYHDRLADVFTLAHELGHAMHFWFARQAQPYSYGDPTAFAGEVAATLNEVLLAHYLIDTADDPLLRTYLVAQRLKEVHVSLYRQSMLAAFEFDIHQCAEAGGTLTTELLCEQYLDLMARYHGPAVALDDLIALEWARDPHLYRGFYIYQYATGTAAALALCEQILAEGPPAVARVLQFLRSGSSRPSIELLRDAGVDMTTPQPVEQAIKSFAALVDQLEALSYCCGQRG